MTEKNLLERMEHCVSGAECVKCPNFQPDDLCVDTMLKGAIEVIKKKNSKIKDLETELLINKGALRAYQEAFENAHDEAVKDFSYFLIDKAKDGCIQINDLPDLVVEWRGELPQSAELTAPSEKEPVLPSPSLRDTSPEGRGKGADIHTGTGIDDGWDTK